MQDLSVRCLCSKKLTSYRNDSTIFDYIHPWSLPHRPFPSCPVCLLGWNRKEP